MNTRVLFVVLVCALNLEAQDQATPRQIFERAAYAEEHERDFEKASKLYAEAAKAAERLDPDLFVQASTAFKRLEARLGRGTDTAPSGELPIAVQRRLYLLVKDLSGPKGADPDPDQKNREAMFKLTPFGAAAVPLLEKALHAETIRDPETQAPFSGDSTWAARTLALTDAPEAAAALRRGLKSPDPFVRRAVVTYLDPKRHRAILDEAMKDSNPSTVATAISVLSRIDDASVLDVMRTAIRRTDDASTAAARWMIENQTEEAIALIKKPEGLHRETVRRLVKEYGEQIPATKRENVARLIDMAESVGDVTLSIELLQSLQNATFKLPEELRDRAETIVLKAFQAGEPKNDPRLTFNLLLRVGGLRTAEMLANLVDEGRLPDWIGDGSHNIQSILGQVEPSQFPRAVAVARKTAARLPHRRSNLFEAIKTASRGANAEDLVAAFETLPEDQRMSYLTHVILSHPTPPVALLRAALKSPEKEDRSKALERMIKHSDDGTVADAVAGLHDPSSTVRGQAAVLLAMMFRKYATPVRGAFIEQLTKLQSDRLDLLGQIAEGLPPAEVVEAIEAVWQQADASRKSGLVGVVLGLGGQPAGTPEGTAFLTRHFEEIKDHNQRMEAIQRFASTLHQPAIELIGKALTDSAPGVRDNAREALKAFREHRDALEEFKRWQTGDAEARASISELLKLLDSNNRDVVVGAVRALGAVKAKSALPALVKLIERNDPEIKKAVDETIKKLSE